MSFDCSRFSFRPWNDFLGVVMQQGRVQLDADWNEWVAELARRLQAGSLDTFGPAVVPRETPNGFRIAVQRQGLAIGPGRIYVDGLLAENHSTGQIKWDRRLAEEAGTGFTLFFEQPYLPFNDEDLPPQDVGSVFNRPSLAGGPYLVYVDVWQREVTYLQSRELVEKAVGVDTTGRLQTVWQVKLLENVEDATCASRDDEVQGWDAIVRPSAARLTTSTGELPDAPNPCLPPPSAGYKGLENQLYRVEIHRGGAQDGQDGKATFKWSRDNATVASRVSAIPTLTTIVVESVGRDDYLRFSNGDWIEILDDWHELHGLPGMLRRIRAGGGVDDATRTITLEAALPDGLFPVDAQGVPVGARNTRVRRWDQAGKVLQADGSVFHDLDASGESNGIPIPPAGTSLFLEHGIQVSFDTKPTGGKFKTGDHWVFAARATDGTIDLLNKAPPRGIHHHYARLSVISDRNPTISAHDATDCRTLWPPEARGESCDCTICIQAEAHNAGIATIQDAINKLTARGGGTICLGIGTYNLREPLSVDGARSLRIRGQGWDTLLVASLPGSVLEITASTGVALESLSLIGSATSATAAILARNTVDLRAEHINVLNLAVGDGTSAAIGLAGYALGASIGDCALVAERGIVRADEYLLSAQLRVTGNLFICSQRAVNLDGVSLHYGNTRIAGNLMLTSVQTAIVATGAVLPDSPFDIDGNVIYTGGAGIRAGIDGLHIRDNEIGGLGERSGDGIVLEEGLDPVALDDVRIEGNRLAHLQGNAIAIHQRVESATIAGNSIDGIGLGALVMGEGGSAGTLRVSSNRCHNLGLAANVEGSAYAAVQLICVERGDFLDNLVAEVARGAKVSPAIAGLRAAVTGQLRIAGNRFLGIGPDHSSAEAEIVAIQVLPPFDRTVIDGNHVDRVGDDAGQELSITRWRAIQIAPAPRGASGYFTAAHFVDAGDSSAYLFTTNRVFSVARHPADALIQGNQLRAHMTGMSLNQCAALDNCLFAGNHCEIVDAGETPPLLGQLEARTLNASQNRLIGLGDHDTLHLKGERAIVMGNTSTGNIISVNGQPVPNDRFNSIGL
ncbi:hypothetical protein E0E54_01520 [Azotobacter chroococcum]|uniref:DUF6519 domain-containing protein n=1 Tax=Azotobacter chroococcum TaxID=353 RepID=UPI00103E9D68|nr:DUF6519 domain-containing protein [Azotobacter chroococcum]TBW39870.1 hypothetical protein E0E54_01520 [Azotobacter chroococcum]